jgi:hypothetical protein
MMPTARGLAPRPRLDALERVVRRELQAGTPSPLALWIQQLGERSGSTREPVARVIARQLLGQQLSGEGDGNTDERL